MQLAASDQTGESPSPLRDSVPSLSPPPSQFTFLDRASPGTKKERKKEDRECHGFLLLHAIDVHSPPSYHVRLSSPAPNLSDKYETPIDKAWQNRLLIPDELVDFEE